MRNSEPLRHALAEVEAFCESRIPVGLRDQIRLEYAVRGNAITIVERRPPWRPDFGPDWTSSEVAQLRYDEGSSTWPLHCRSARGRWFLYDEVEPSRDVAPLLTEIDADPTGIFWG